VSKRNFWSRWGIPILCLWLAFLLRIYGFDFGLPYHFHPDEDQHVDVALRWYTEGQLEPRLINPPLFTYVLTMAYGLWVAVSPIEPSPEWISAAYVFARLWSAIFGTLTVALMYALGKRLYNHKTGLLAMVLLAGLFLPARESHFAVNDTAVTFFALVAIYFSVGIFYQPQRASYLAAGIAVGLATATKFTAGLVVLTPIVAHLLMLTRSPGESHQTLLKSLLKWKRYHNLWFSLLAAALAFFTVASFHIFQRFPQLVQIITWHLAQSDETYKGTAMAPASGWQFYINVFGWGLGWLMFMAIIIVLGAVIFYRYRPGLILAIFPLTLFLYMGSQKIVFARYMLPTVPPLVALVSVALVWAVTRRPFLSRHQRLFWSLIVGLLLIQPLTNLIWFDYLLTLPDTRELATEWFTGEISDGTLVAIEEYSILPGTVFWDNYNWPYEIFSLNNQEVQPKNEMGHYLARKTEVIALSNFTSGRIRTEPAIEQLRHDQLAFWDQEAILLKVFSPYQAGHDESWFYHDQIYGPAGETLQRVRPGPLITLYRLPYEKQPYTLTVPEIAQPLQANFANKIMLLGYELNNYRAQAGESFSITLYWQALTRMYENYVIFNHLLDEQQQNWGGYDRLPQELSKTALWIPQEVVIDTFDLPVADDTPDGIYTIDIGLYNQTDPAANPLPLVFNGRPVDQNSIRLGPVKVGNAPPDVLLPDALLSPQNVLMQEMGQPPTILFHGYDMVPAQDSLQLTFYWESLAQTLINWTTFVHLKDEQGKIVAQKDGPTGSGLYPTSLWDVDEVIADQVLLPRPP